VNLLPRAEIAQLQRVLGTKTMEAEILREAIKVAREKVDCSLTVIGQRWQAKPVCAGFGVARSNVIDRLARPADWVDSRTQAKLDRSLTRRFPTPYVLRSQHS